MRRNFLKHLLATAAALAVMAPPAVLAQGKAMVGIAMPTKSSARWIADGDNMVKQFKEAGYETDLQYANDDTPAQLSQVENMITAGAKVLVIAALDGTTLSNALETPPRWICPRTVARVSMPVSASIRYANWSPIPPSRGRPTESWARAE